MHFIQSVDLHDFYGAATHQAASQAAWLAGRQITKNTENLMVFNVFGDLGGPETPKTWISYSVFCIP